MLSWERLLTSERLRRPRARGTKTRSAFQQDADLVVFSGAFRRLSEKTQVQPLAEGGRVRSRLTHSIEVACVGRSLGSAVGYGLHGRGSIAVDQGEAIADIVYAACLAHDIGNPPFGHGGEDAIQAWFRAHPQVLASLSSEQAADLRAFDGNAQGFRTLTQLENYRFDGGLRLTHATLGALLKYAVSAEERDPSSSTRKKPGFFSAERPYVEELRSSFELAPGVRHPLVYLTEAADDICYAIVDLEDGCAAGLLDHREAVDVLEALAGQPGDRGLERLEQLQKLRGVAIGRLVEACAEAFLELEPSLMAGREAPELWAATAFAPALARAKELARARIYTATAVVERLLSGQVVLGALLDACVPVVAELESAGFDRGALRGRAASLAHLFGSTFEPRTRYDALLAVTDFLSGLTDRSALTLHRRLVGVA